MRLTGELLLGELTDERQDHGRIGGLHRPDVDAGHQFRFLLMVPHGSPSTLISATDQ